MKKTQIRVLSYNIHKGFTSYNRKFILTHIREAIQLVHADLVFLQEVIGQHDLHAKKFTHWPENTQFEFIADSIWPHYAYGKNAVYTEGHHGNAILSKYPIVFSENVDVSMSRLENRGLLHVIIEVPHHKKPLHAICIHLGLFEADRKKQVDVLCQRIEAIVPHDEPLVVAGDFNDWREQATRPLQKRVDLKEAFHEIHRSHVRTFPCWLPVLKLDRIYYRGLSVSFAECLSGNPWNTLSDHAAISAQFKF